MIGAELQPHTRNVLPAPQGCVPSLHIPGQAGPNPTKPPAPGSCVGDAEVGGCRDVMMERMRLHGMEGMWEWKGWRDAGCGDSRLWGYEAARDVGMERMWGWKGCGDGGDIRLEEM